MNKQRFLLIALKIIISISGIYLIGDFEIIFGVIMLMWANNFDYQRKVSPRDSA